MRKNYSKISDKKRIPQNTDRTRVFRLMKDSNYEYQISIGNDNSVSRSQEEGTLDQMFNDLAMSKFYNIEKIKTSTSTCYGANCFFSTVLFIILGIVGIIIWPYMVVIAFGVYCFYLSVCEAIFKCYISLKKITRAKNIKSKIIKLNTEKLVQFHLKMDIESEGDWITLSYDGPVNELQQPAPVPTLANLSASNVSITIEENNGLQQNVNLVAVVQPELHEIIEVCDEEAKNMSSQRGLSCDDIILHVGLPPDRSGKKQSKDELQIDTVLPILPGMSDNQKNSLIQISRLSYYTPTNIAVYKIKNTSTKNFNNMGCGSKQ